MSHVRCGQIGMRRLVIILVFAVAGLTALGFGSGDLARYELPTHCGIPLYIHFRDSWYRLANRGEADHHAPLMGFGYYTTGVMLIVGTGHAVFVYPGSVISYTRFGSHAVRQIRACS